MSLRVNEIGNDNFTQVKPASVDEAKRKKQQNSILVPEGQFTAYMPLGGIGSLLNGKGTQTTAAAAQV